MKQVRAHSSGWQALKDLGDMHGPCLLWELLASFFRLLNCEIEMYGWI